jgi:hypothetical protein
MKTPCGLTEIIEVFGSLDDKDFIKNNFDFVRFPFPLAYSNGVVSTKVSKAPCHKLVAPILETVFKDIVKEGMQEEVKTFGGLYVRRTQHTKCLSAPSTHCWAISIDLNPKENTVGESGLFMGSSGEERQIVVEIFNKHGFFWGGDFKHRKDKSHFQFATNY